jgi:hypothetical protein
MTEEGGFGSETLSTLVSLSHAGPGESCPLRATQKVSGLSQPRNLRKATGDGHGYRTSSNAMHGLD